MRERDNERERVIKTNGKEKKEAEREEKEKGCKGVLSADGRGHCPWHWKNRFVLLTGLTLDPEDAKVPFVVKLEQLLLVDGTHTQLALNGANKRRALSKEKRLRRSVSRRTRYSTDDK